MKKTLTAIALCCLGLLTAPFLTSPAAAADVYLVARQFTKAMPDGASITMWGFATDGDSNLATIGTEAATSPGPMITVPPGDGALNIHLRNDLAVPVSIVIPGLTSLLTPVRFTDTQGRGRVQSFTKEVLPGATGTYTWTGVRPGSYIYHSGTHPAVQVQMGLYGGMKKDFATKQAYGAASAYVNEVILFHSEIDAALHDAVSKGIYGTAAYPGTINYAPRYFLVNGEPYTAGQAPVAAGNNGEATILRFFNAGMETRVPQLQGLYMRLISEDGRPYPFPRDEYSVLLPAGKTADAVVTPNKGGVYPLFDRRGGLTTGAQSPGGMITELKVTGTLSANNDSYSVNQDTPLNVPAPGVLANDSLVNGATASIVTGTAHGAVTLNVDGSFSFTPSAGFSGADSFTYRITSGGQTSNDATVSITVNPVVPPPVARNDAYSTNEDTPLNMAALNGVLSNDTLNGANPSAVLVTNGAHGAVTLNGDGSFRYVPAANFNGTDSFTYKITTSALTSNTATVTITVNPVNDPPVAANDAATTFKNDPVLILVLSNDTDVDGDPLTVQSLSAPANGVAVVNADNTVTYTPRTGYFGTDTFTYKAFDGKAASNTATVTVTVRNRPDAVADAYTVTEDTVLNVAAPGVMSNDVINEPNPSAVVVAKPSKGLLTLNPNGSFTYTPALNFFGTDSFTYMVNTATVSSNVAIVTITVTPVNDPPVAAYDASTGPVNTPQVINVLANDTDPDGDTLSVRSVTAPANGTVVINPDNTVTYTPRTGFSGTDTFFYVATDGTLNSNNSRVTVTVTPNKAPVAVADYASTPKNTPVAINLLANDYDTDGTLVPGSVTLTIPARGGTVVNNKDGTVTFTPKASFIGSDYFFYTVKDNLGAVSKSAKVTVKVLR